MHKCWSFLRKKPHESQVKTDEPHSRYTFIFLTYPKSSLSSKGRLGHGNEENQIVPKRVLTLSYPTLRVQRHPATTVSVTAPAAEAIEGGGLVTAAAASAVEVATTSLIPRYSGLRCKVKQVKCGGFHTAATTGWFVRS